jgi:hypothetical protein
MLRGLLADAVDSERDLHHDVMALELFQSFPLRNEALGSAVFTIYSATGWPRSAPLPLARRIKCGDGSAADWNETDGYSAMAARGVHNQPVSGDMDG